MPQGQLKVTLETAALMQWLRVDEPTEEALLESLLETAKSEAYQFLNTDFHTYDAETGELVTENEAPAPVKTWLMNRVAQLYENRGVPVPPDFALIHPFREYPMMKG